MNLIKINDIKLTMSMILLKNTFDGFFLEEAEVFTYAKLVLNGRRNKKWYEGEETLDRDFSTELVRWREVKHIFFEYIKGKKTPDIFKISLKADEKIAEIFLKDSGFYERYIEEKPELHLQLRYEKKELCVVTGIYNNSFTLDKTVENAWDEAVVKWFIKNNISVL